MKISHSFIGPWRFFDEISLAVKQQYTRDALGKDM
jgi:hypothetical protein